MTPLGEKRNFDNSRKEELESLKPLEKQTNNPVILGYRGLARAGMDEMRFPGMSSSYKAV